MKLKNIIIIVIFILGAVACNQDEVFEKEQYKNVFALISSGSENVFSKYFDLRKEESTGYISLSMGGTNATTEDVIINLVEDESYIKAYNNANYDLDVDKYIQPLPKSKYDIESLQCTIPAGAIGTQIPVHIRPEGLSPDSSYFIAVRVDSYNKYEVNPDKSFILYRVFTENYWTIGKSNEKPASYRSMAKRQEVGAVTGISVPGSKVMHPISVNEVRIMAGTETYKSEKPTLYKSAIVLKIDEDNKVTISPYKDVVVTQIDGDPDYPNIFKLEDTGYNTYKTFLLHYSYKSADGKTYEMREELRLEYDPKKEKED